MGSTTHSSDAQTPPAQTPPGLTHTRVTLRMAVVVALGMGLIAAGVVLRPPPRDGLFWSGGDRESYFEHKLQATQRADVVLAGNSHVYRGLSPKAIEAALGDRRTVYNFGFSAAAFTPDYLAAVRQQLSPDAKRPTIVLGLSPIALSDRTAHSNGFTKASRRARSTHIMGWSLPTQWTLPLSPYRRITDLKRFGRPWPQWNPNTPHTIDQAETVYFEQAHPNGWVASWSEPQLQTDFERTHRAYQKYTRGPMIQPKLLANLLETIERWTQQGITVVALRPPVDASIRALENGPGQFNEDELAAKLQKAGARWLKLDPAQYPTYDGHHLRRDGALKLSQTLGTFLR